MKFLRHVSPPFPLRGDEAFRADDGALVQVGMISYTDTNALGDGPFSTASECNRLAGRVTPCAPRLAEDCEPYLTTSNAKPFKYSVSGIIGMTGWSGLWEYVATRRNTWRVS